jgi:hypothetical protein
MLRSDATASRETSVARLAFMMSRKRGAWLVAGVAALSMTGCTDLSDTQVPRSETHDVDVVVLLDGERMPACNIAFVGSPEDGSPLTEEGHITGETGTTSRALPPGSYTVTASCAASPSNAVERSFDVGNGDLEIRMELAPNA